MTTVTCKRCGIDFQAKQRNRQYCDDCRYFRRLANNRKFYRNNPEKYKAYKQKVRERRKAMKILVTVTCKMCGAEFQARQRNRKYCDGCRLTRLTLYSRNYYLKNCERIRAKYERKSQRTVKCAICGKEFLTKSNRQKYCDDCRVKHVTEYRHKYYKENRERLMKYQHRYYLDNRAGILEYDRKRKRILKGG